MKTNRYVTVYKIARFCIQFWKQTLLTICLDGLTTQKIRKYLLSSFKKAALLASMAVQVMYGDNLMAKHDQEASCPGTKDSNHATYLEKIFSWKKRNGN